MSSTIEGTNSKIMEKIFNARRGLEILREVQRDMYAVVTRNTHLRQITDELNVNLTIDALERVESDYQLTIAPILATYYTGADENRATKDYYRCIVGANFISRINSVVLRIQHICDMVIGSKQYMKKAEFSALTERIFLVQKLAEISLQIDVRVAISKKNFEVCKCGERMKVMAELSELHCVNPACMRTKYIIGAVFRDDQFYPQEGQTTKHSDYDTGRHYRFWIERLQATENKVFLESDINKIEYVIARDGYDAKTLDCEQMRGILKDSLVAATKLNDHVPLLVKTFGGPAPPRLTAHEDRILSIRFNKAMRLYDIVNPSTGNKPYYPYFIFKLIEELFKGQPEKLRLLDYIHLQSIETVIKNDINYEKMAALAGPNDGIVYRATDHVGRL